jgi:hydroxymethylpyrimidine/phosphomethylpyrimidine kinase
VTKRKRLPIGLTIAGSDSGGGAGIQADLKTFAALGVHGTCVVTSVTAQNPREVLAVHACPPSIVQRQLEAVFDELAPAAVKTGMLFTAATVRCVVRFLARNRRPPLVVDPVMISTSGARLLAPRAIELMIDELLPLAALVTPNLAEAEALLGERIRSVEDQRAAAKEIRSRFGCAALVKGGHMRGSREAVDFYFDGRTELLLTAPRIRGLRTHGTGCVLSAAIVAWLARGLRLAEAVTRAKEYVSGAIADGGYAGGHFVLRGNTR